MRSPRILALVIGLTIMGLVESAGAALIERTVKLNVYSASLNYIQPDRYGLRWWDVPVDTFV